MVSTAAPRLLVLAALLGLGGSASAAANFYCCLDAGGKQVCGDILPQACYGRAYRELGADGRTIRTVEAPLSAEKRAQRAAEEAQRQADEAILREKQRQDQALLNTYGSEKDIEMMRARALDEVQKSILAAQAKIAEMRVKRKNFENEAEFYKKKPLPPEVQKGLRDADSEIKAQELVIEAKKRELEAIRAKYDDDRRRYLDLSRRAPAPR
ncbi:MAG: hypothetical protein H6R17_415 [Proteobacteria bacterium]|nr:hypothetical protein [Pseudomonadota bacterium]